MNIFEIDWKGKFTLGVSPLENVLRGTVDIFVLFILFRLAPGVPRAILA